MLTRTTRTMIALLLALLLPSCITDRLWSGEPRLQTERFDCQSAVACLGTPDSLPRLALRLEPTAVHAIDAAATTAGAHAWIELQPEDSGPVAEVLRHLRRADAGHVDFTVRFHPPVAGAARAADVSIHAEFHGELESSGIEDVRPSRQALRRQQARSLCAWRVLPAEPAGEPLPRPEVLVLDHGAAELATPVKVVLTPLAVAGDIALSPFYLLAAIVYRLAD